MMIYIIMSRSKFSSLAINLRNNFSWQFISSHQTRCDSCIRIKTILFLTNLNNIHAHNEIFIRIVMQYWCTLSFLSMDLERDFSWNSKSREIISHYFLFYGLKNWGCLIFNNFCWVGFCMDNKYRPPTILYSAITTTHSRFYHVNIIFVVVNLMFMNVVSQDWGSWMRKNKTFFLFVPSFLFWVIEAGNDFFICFSLNLIQLFVATTKSLKDKNIGI